MIEKDALWFIIIGLGVGSFALRFAFTGLVGDRTMPPWLLRPQPAERPTRRGLLPRQ